MLKSLHNPKITILESEGMTEIRKALEGAEQGSFLSKFSNDVFTVVLKSSGSIVPGDTFHATLLTFSSHS